MQAAQLWPGDGENLAGRVQLHRARAQRDHGSRQREVARLQALEIAHHLRLGVVTVEDGVGQKPAGTDERGSVGRISFRGQLRHSKVRSAVPVEYSENVSQVLLSRCLVERDANRMLVDSAEVHPLRLGPLQKLLLGAVAEA